jgi:hypothetical protein
MITIGPPPSSSVAVTFLAGRRGVGSQKRKFSADLIEVEIIGTTPLVLSPESRSSPATPGV